MCYFKSLFHKTEEVVDTLAHWLKHPKLGQVDCVVGIGLSGTMALIPIRQKTGVNIRALRKKGTESHGGDSACSDYTNKARYVIIDDFVASGRTLWGVRNKLKEIAPQWECVGVLLYNQWGGSDTFTDVPIYGLVQDVDELVELRKREVKDVRT